MGQSCLDKLYFSIYCQVLFFVMTCKKQTIFWPNLPSHENITGHVKGLKENVLQFRERWTGRNRNIKSNRVPTSRLNIIHYSPARKMERLFNCLPQKIKSITGVNTETFKKRLDDWLRTVPDQPRIDDYGASVAAETNSIEHQVRYAR